MGKKKCLLLKAIIFWFLLQLCAFTVFSWTIDDPEYNAVIDAEVELPCNITPPSPDDSIALVLWYRGDSGNPIYSLDARDQHTGEPKHIASEILGSRATFNHTAKPAYLQIKPIVDGDAGEYRCRVDFKRARTTNKAMKLNVIVPPEKILIYNNENKSMIGPFRENSNLNLTCEVRGGSPSPAVTWWRESTQIDDSYSRIERGLVINELLVTNLKRDDLLSVYMCQASNTNLTVPISTSVTIDLNLKPLEVRIISTHRTFSEGKEYEVMCQSKGSRPPAQITWMKGNVKIDSSQEITSEDGDTTTSTLTFVPSSEDNRKSLLCRAENPDLPESALNDEWTMNVLYVPQLSLALGASDKHEQIREGSNVYFECNIQANPSIYEIGWKYEGKTLVHDPPSGINVRNYTLFLQGVRRSHRGRYQCVARNAEGEGASEEVLLRVQFAPVCSSGQKVVYGAARHEDVRVTCEVDADPPSVEFRWGFNNTDESLVIVSYTTSGTKSVAKYVPRNKQDYGYLYCWGKNEVGMQLEPCIFSIVPIGELQPVAINAVLAVLMGTVGALLLLVIVIIFIMKARGSNENRGASTNIDNEEKIPSPIKKEFDDGSPDVIPSKNYSTEYSEVSPRKKKEYDYRNERIYENVEENKEHTYENIIPRMKYKPKLNYDDITYAELDLPNNQQAAVRERIDPPTEYADIDFQKITKTVSSPGNENEEDDCVQTPLITSKLSGCTSSMPDRECLRISPPV
ncbi:synaptogenesis protein syg-2-like isoform X2 [Centruroides vittatus]|uniref:synaptogenesis protein syg-2-like isoform X2 n=1 Tax=Centruroides vittatus TaxID=120091 RepID=UPI00350EB51C